MTSNNYSEMLKLPVADLRDRIRAGAYRGQTAGFAPGNLQANLAILGDGYAEDFREFCDQNSQPCPLVGVSGRGDPAWLQPFTGFGVDDRTIVVPEIPGLRPSGANVTLFEDEHNRRITWDHLLRQTDGCHADGRDV